ncbi:MAG: AAA family ATPase [Roseiarcus sp.]|jgi:tRNA A37 threonylcarbamoyladenosine biosynthesis protein TsaE
MHAYERWILRRYLANALRSRHFAKPPRADGDIVVWIENHARLLGLPDLAARACSTRRRTPVEAPMQLASWKAWRTAVIGTARTPAPNPSPLQKRVDWLARACSLSESQNSALGLLARATRTPQFRSLVEAVNDRFGVDPEYPDVVDLHPFLETKSERLELCSGARLCQLGLIEVQESPRLSAVVRRLLSLPRFGARRVSDLLLGEPARASLGWGDFEHLGDLRDLAARIVAAAGGSRGAARRGVNLLFYGPPGTGKSEFAKTLGARLGFSVQFCGETNDENAEPNRRERIAALLIANAIGGVARRTIVVVDEADDLFAGFGEDDGFGRRGSKVFMNRLLERAAAPTIWITNDVRGLGSAIIRRMNLALRFSKPALSVRKAMVAQIAQGAGFRWDEGAALDLARSAAPPALIENAILSAAHIRGSATDARKILESSVHALGVRETPRAPAPIAFDPALSSADVDLAALADQVVRSRSCALSFCLSGLPGTGKSAYARYLADRLDLDVLEKRYSDLSSMWLGESEKAIAAAFEEAADLRAFLILDEADSLLRDRSAAHYSWEITQVNEMLTSIERHPYPFALTTNAPDILDPALARRILFKVRFLSMTREQIAAAFSVAFGAEAPVSVLKLTGLTPGDFATVARKGAVLGERDPRLLAKWLEDEALAKPGAGRRKIGF